MCKLPDKPIFLQDNCLLSGIQNPNVEDGCDNVLPAWNMTGYHGVPNEREHGADGESFDEDFVAEGARGKDGGFPVGRSCVCGGLFVRLANS